MTALELLAPAKDIETAIAAIDSGADAIYIGAANHGARASAGNSTDNIARICKYAHAFRVKVYVTLNTLIYNNEIEEVRRLVYCLYEAGVDALIVQDMALMEMDIPPIPLHASTQCDTRTPEKARFLQDAGFSQIVLPREMTPDEIRKVREVTDVQLEAFVHGALCVCYSGNCKASFVGGGRSANRGECAQICRLPYSLKDGKGKIITESAHLLSLKDLNRFSELETLVRAGITSFKIEGRLKSVDYVRNVTLAYSQALNALIRKNGSNFCRTSKGEILTEFKPNLDKTFNRGYTNYFLTPEIKSKVAEHRTPKHIGLPVGVIEKSTKDKIWVNSSVAIHNGDGLGFFDRDNKFSGFRVNRVEGKILHLLPQSGFRPPVKGTHLYRHFDKEYIDNLRASTFRRVIDVAATLRAINDGISLTLEDCRGCRVSQTLKVELCPARTPQIAKRQETISKTGSTIFRITNFTDELGEDVFVPASALSELKREALLQLDIAAQATYPFEKRSEAMYLAPTLSNKILTADDNVANVFAERFYKKCGAEIQAKAVELTGVPETASEIKVMTCKYCLRRELDACLRTPNGKNILGPLYLHPVDAKIPPMRLDFDCSECRMSVVALIKNR